MNDVDVINDLRKYIVLSWLFGLPILCIFFYIFPFVLDNFPGNPLWILGGLLMVYFGFVALLINRRFIIRLDGLSPEIYRKENGDSINT